MNPFSYKSLDLYELLLAIRTASPNSRMKTIINGQDARLESVFFMLAEAHPFFSYYEGALLVLFDSLSSSCVAANSELLSDVLLFLDIIIPPQIPCPCFE